MPPSKDMAAFRDTMVKKYGAAVTRQETAPPAYEVCSTGILGLDYATGIGGLVRGRIVQYWGPEGVGKTTGVIHAMAAGQRQYPNLACGYIDMEQSFDWDWARNHGLDTSEKRFFHVFPDNSEDVSDQIKEMANSGMFSHIVVDSIGGMESQKAFDKDAGESNMGKNAQIITRMTKALTVNARKNGVYVILVNQVRANFNSPTGGDTFSGPKNLKHHTTMNMRFSRTGEPPLKIRENGEDLTVGKEVRVRVERNKVAAEGRSTSFWIINYPTEQYGPIGIDRMADAVNIGQLSGVITRGGAYYSLPDGTRHMGAEKMKAHLREHPDVVELIRAQAIATRKGEVIPEPPEVTFTPEFEAAE